jgi:outer membrane protein OmpA-like peptidoglycan-associated protein
MAGRRRKTEAAEQSAGAEAAPSGKKTDWATISAIAVAITAVSGAVVAVSKNVRELIFGPEHAVTAGPPASNGVVANGAAAQPPPPVNPVPIPPPSPPPPGARNVHLQIAVGRDRVVLNGNLSAAVQITTSNGTRVTVCPGQIDASGACIASPPEARNCPDGSVILQTESCPLPAAVGPYIVFFDWDKDEITPEAARILDEATAAYQQVGHGSLTLAGHADRSGPAGYNVGLSQRRANNVRSYLAGRGVPEGSINTEAFGESRPRVESADGVREPQNRYVGIVFGPGP